MKKYIIESVDKLILNNEAEQINFLQKLIKINSSNPFTPEKSIPEEPIEKEIAETIFEKLEEIGLAPEYKGVSPYRPNVIAKFSGAGNKSLILNGHMDTVLPSQNYTYDPFGATISGNKLYGLGALDMKASLSIFIYATKALLEAGLKLNGDLILTFVVDEEPGGCSNYGTRFLLRNGLTGDAAIVAEPGNRNIAIGHRGGYRFKLTVIGESIHTGFKVWETGKKGKNAILDMSKVITELADIKISFEKTPAFKDRLSVFTFPTIIEGGTSINVVPDTCIAYGDCRLLPGNTSDTVSELIHNKLLSLPQINYTLEDLIYVPAVEISRDEEIVNLVKSNRYDVLGEEPSMFGVGPWNDGWMFIKKGIPAICGFGPNGRGVHSPDEYVLLDSLIETTKIYARIIIDFLGISIS